MPGTFISSFARYGFFQNLLHPLRKHDPKLRDDSVIQSSQMITIISGEQKEKIPVHRDVLGESTSASLRALVNGKWKEGVKKSIDWSHTDKDTVVRFISWLYTKDYDIDIPAAIESTSEEEEEEEAKQETCASDPLNPYLDTEF